jgi:hypothetical protein
MESILGDGGILSGETRVTTKKGHNFLFRMLDRAQIFTGVDGGCFPWRCYGIDTR